MFQFRPFPSYAYLIQRTITRYCRAGFPHSEIHGCNGYLLLPVAYRSLSRPSSAPDAKAFPLRSFQLDLVGAKSACLRFRRWPMAPGENCARSLAPPLQFETASLGFKLVLRSDSLSRIMQALFGRIFRCEIASLTFRCFHNLLN